MRQKVLALEEERLESAQALVDLGNIELEVQADDQHIDELETQSRDLAEHIDSAEDAIETVGTLEEVTEVTRQETEETEGGSRALDVAMEHFYTRLGMTKEAAKITVATESGFTDTLKRVGQALWRLLQKIADWLMTLYQKLVFSIERMKKRAARAKQAARSQGHHDGGHVIKNRTLRNFFNYRGKDYRESDIAGAMSKNVSGVEKLWSHVSSVAESTIESTQYILDHPILGFLSDSAGGVNQGREREIITRFNDFVKNLFSSMSNNNTFSSERVQKGGAHLVVNKMHMPFGNYVMSFTMMDAHAPKVDDTVMASALMRRVKSSFGYEPPEHAEKREVLKSLSSKDIEEVLRNIDRDIHAAERIAAEAAQIQKKIKALSNRSMNQTLSKVFQGDQKDAASFAIAFSMVNMLNRFAHGPVGGLSLYMLKSTHYSLHLVERSLKLNAQGIASEEPLQELHQLALPA
jgi:ribosomal protein L12E/L44/L45/RPP1/RPP2